MDILRKRKIKLKRILCTCILAAMLLCLFACTGNEQTNAQSTSNIPSVIEIPKTAATSEPENSTTFINTTSAAQIATEKTSEVNTTATMLSSTAATEAVQTSDKAETDSEEIATTEKTEKMVWISATGKKYHSRSGCSNMKNPSQISISRAMALGYAACKRCH